MRDAAPHAQDAHAEAAHASDDEHAGATPVAGSQAAELITTTLLFISCVLSWLRLLRGRLRRP